MTVAKVIERRCVHCDAVLVPHPRPKQWPVKVCPNGCNDPRGFWKEKGW